MDDLCSIPQAERCCRCDYEGYLREVLARINGKQSPRALPANLPEWKHVNIHAEFWAVRHYQKTGAEQDHRRRSIADGERRPIRKLLA